MNFAEALRQYNELKLDEIDGFTRYNEFAAVYYNARLVGSELTLAETEWLLADGIYPSGKPSMDIALARQLYDALQFTLQLSHKKGLIQAGHLQKINAMITQRNVDQVLIEEEAKALITSYLLSVANDLPQLKNEEEKVQFSFSTLYAIVKLGPFIKANTRTAILLMQYFQHKWGIPISYTFSQNINEFMGMLEDSILNNNPDEFIIYMQHSYIRQLSEEINRVKNMLN